MPAYINAVENAFGGAIDFAQLIKIYGTEQREQRYSPPEVQEVISKVISGKPDAKRISTSYIERQNLTVRMQLRRLTRLTNAFSKKMDNLKAALAMHFAHYNFMRVHKTLSVTPAMATGITDHIWGWGGNIGVFKLSGLQIFLQILNKYFYRTQNSLCFIFSIGCFRMHCLVSPCNFNGFKMTNY